MSPPTSIPLQTNYERYARYQQLRNMQKEGQKEEQKEGETTIRRRL